MFDYLKSAIEFEQAMPVAKTEAAKDEFAQRKAAIAASLATACLAHTERTDLFKAPVKGVH
jgi:hypothetical protein